MPATPSSQPAMVGSGRRELVRAPMCRHRQTPLHLRSPPAREDAPLITCPCPSVNEKGSPRSRELSNFEPSL